MDAAVLGEVVQGEDLAGKSCFRGLVERKAWVVWVEERRAREKLEVLGE